MPDPDDLNPARKALKGHFQKKLSNEFVRNTPLLYVK